MRGNDLHTFKLDLLPEPDPEEYEKAQQAVRRLTEGLEDQDQILQMIGVTW